MGREVGTMLIKLKPKKQRFKPGSVNEAAYRRSGRRRDGINRKRLEENWDDINWRSKAAGNEI